MNQAAATTGRGKKITRARRLQLVESRGKLRKKGRERGGGIKTVLRSDGDPRTSQWGRRAACTRRVKSLGLSLSFSSPPSSPRVSQAHSSLRSSRERASAPERSKKFRCRRAWNFLSAEPYSGWKLNVLYERNWG